MFLSVVFSGPPLVPWTGSRGRPVDGRIRRDALPVDKGTKRGPEGDQNGGIPRLSRLQSASGALPWPSWSLRAGVSAEEGVGLFRGGGEVAVVGVEVAASGLD